MWNQHTDKSLTKLLAHSFPTTQLTNKGKKKVDINHGISAVLKTLKFMKTGSANGKGSPLTAVRGHMKS